MNEITCCHCGNTDPRDKSVSVKTLSSVNWDRIHEFQLHGVTLGVCKRCSESYGFPTIYAAAYALAPPSSSSVGAPHAAPASSSPEDTPDEIFECQYCGEHKPIEAFPPHYSLGGIFHWCNECNRDIEARAVKTMTDNVTGTGKIPPEVLQYAPLRQALDDAFQRATQHKGAQRHGEPGVDFLDQIGPMIARNKLRWTLGQIAKKAFECERVTPDHAQKELHDIIIIATIEILNLKQNGNTNHTNQRNESHE